MAESDVTRPNTASAEVRQSQFRLLNDGVTLVPYVSILGTTPVPTSQAAPGAATVAQVASSITSVTLLAANTARRGFVLFNDSTAILSIKFGATASATSKTVNLGAGQTYEAGPNTYTGRVDGIWAAVNGNAYVTEY